MEKVKWWEYSLNEKGVYIRENGEYVKEEGIGLFRQFGIAYEEFESGPGQYSTAIIELQDGTIKNIPVEQIRFIKGGK